MAGECSADKVITEATAALRGGAGIRSSSATELFEANKELLALHELIAHRIFQILVGQHRGRTYSIKEHHGVLSFVAAQEVHTNWQSISWKPVIRPKA